MLSLLYIAAYVQAAFESDALDERRTQLWNAIAHTQRVRKELKRQRNRHLAARFGRALGVWARVLGKELQAIVHESDALTAERTR